MGGSVGVTDDESFEIGCPTFVEPEMIPAGTSDTIPDYDVEYSLVRPSVLCR